MRLSILFTLILVVAAPATAQVCGDVTGDGQISVTDGVNVLRGAAGLSATLTCGPPGPAGCGDGVIAGSEQCDFGNLAGQTCATQGRFGTGLACNPATCTFDVSACAPSRFVDNGDGTVTDFQTGLQWEQKVTGGSSAQNLADPTTWTTSIPGAISPGVPLAGARMGRCSGTSWGS